MPTISIPRVWTAGHKTNVLCPAYDADAVLLPYMLADSGKRQPRFRGRLLIDPQLDLASYRIQSVVDWVDLRVRLGRRTQFRYVQDALMPVIGRKAWVERVNGADDEENTVFDIRVHDVTRKLLDRVRAALDTEYKLVAEPQPIAIEVAVDFYPLDQKAESRQQMVGLLQRHFLPQRKAWQARHGWPRTTVEHVSAGKAVSSRTFRIGAGRDKAAAPFLDGTFYAGPDEKYDEEKVGMMWRVQDKIGDQRTHDKTNPTFILLSDAERRARIEVTLTKGAFEALGIDTLTKLKAYDFRKLKTAYFAFWNATLPGDERKGPAGVSLAKQRELYLKAFENAGVFGAMQLDQRWLLGQRKKWEELTAEERREAKNAGEHERPLIGKWIKGESEKAEPWLAGESGHLVAYKELNDAMKKALRHPRF